MPMPTQQPRCTDCGTQLDAQAHYCYACGEPSTCTGHTVPLNRVESQRRWLQRYFFIRLKPLHLLIVTAIVSFFGGFLLRPVVPAHDLPTITAQAPAFVAMPATAVATSSPQSLSPAYLALNIKHYPTFTVYWKRDLWERAISGNVITEDFSQDTAEYGELSFPYLTGHDLLLEGHSAAQILNDNTLLESGTLLHFRDWEQGLTVRFPNDVPVSTFGFDYQPSETWTLKFNHTNIAIPKGRNGFVGIVFRDDYPKSFVLAGPDEAQGGLSIDNIGFIEAPSP